MIALAIGLFFMDLGLICFIIALMLEEENHVGRRK